MMSALAMRSSQRAAAAIAMCLFASIASAQQATARTAGPTARIVGAANRFLATLDPQQRGKVSFAFDDDAQRTRWSNLPVRTATRRCSRSWRRTKC